MRATDEQIRQQITALINEAGRSPYLFLGSGFSRRYIGTENWEGLLRSLITYYSTDDYLYDKYKVEVSITDGQEDKPLIASLMERDLKRAVLSDPALAEFRNRHAESIRASESILKLLAAEHIAKFTTKHNTDELDKLKEAGKGRISGIITTNYDCLVEALFPNFKTFIGQEDLLFQQLYEIGEIYKIHGSVAEPSTMVLTADDYAMLASQEDYLVAKLLTIFVEYPIIFIGYSINDSDIQSILRSLARCLNKAHLKRLRNRFIFVGRGENDISSHTISFEGNDSIEMTRISIDDFGIVYDAVALSHGRFSPRLLRDLRRSIYELVATNEPTAKTIVTGFDALEFIPEDMEIVIGAGTVPATRAKYGHVIKPELLYRDVILDNEFLPPKTVIEEYLPELLPGNSGGLPMYKYLSAYAGEVTDPRTRKLLAEKKTMANFLHNQQRKWKESYRKSHDGLSIPKLIEMEGFDDALTKMVFLESDEIDLNELRLYLAEILRKDPHVLKDNPELKRVIRVYDFLKYKGASFALTNSEPLDT